MVHPVLESRNMFFQHSENYCFWTEPQNYIVDNLHATVHPGVAFAVREMFHLLSVLITTQQKLLQKRQHGEAANTITTTFPQGLLSDLQVCPDMPTWRNNVSSCFVASSSWLHLNSVFPSPSLDVSHQHLRLLDFGGAVIAGDGNLHYQTVSLQDKPVRQRSFFISMQ